MKIKVSEKVVLTVEVQVSQDSIFMAHGKAMDIATRYEVLDNTVYSVHISGYGEDIRSLDMLEMNHFLQLENKYPEDNDRVIQYVFPPLEKEVVEELRKAFENFSEEV